MVKVIQVFRTEDNHQFDTREEAHAHEVNIEALNALKKILEISMRAGPGPMLKEMLLESQAISDVLTRYRKRTPKVKETVGA